MSTGKVFNQPSRARASAHTLLEMMLSLVLLSIVMASVTSAVIFASSANPKPDGREATLAKDSRVLSRIAEDLSVARYVLEQSAHAVTFVVSDRTGDGTPDRIRYAWSGTYGDALTYQLNDEDPVVLIDSHAIFDIAYTTETVSTVLPVATVIGEESVLDSYTSVFGSDDKVKTNRWLGQVVSPGLSSGAIGFIPTQLDIYAGWDNPNTGETLIQLRERTGATPGSTAYGQGILREVDMSGATYWETIPLSGTSPVAKNQDLAITIEYYAGSHDVLQVRKVLGATGFLSTDDAGASWSASLLEGMPYRVYGREIIADRKQHTVSRMRLTRINLSLQSVASGGRSPLKRVVRMMLAPPKLDAFAETEFDVDPTRMDLNNDKTPDWSHSSGSFPAGSISGGTWTADGTLIFEPTGLSSADVITLTARMRGNDTMGPTIYGPYTINSSGDGLPVITQLRTDGQGGQELVIYNGFSLSDPYITISDLPSGLVDIGLTLIPDEDYLLIEVNHEPKAAVILERVNDPGTVDQAVWLKSSGGVAAFGSAYIKVGGGYTTQTREEGEEDGGLIGDVLDLLF